QEQPRGLGEGPLELGVADLLAREAGALARRLLGTLDQPAIGHEILHPGEAGDVLELIQDDQRENLANAPGTDCRRAKLCASCPFAVRVIESSTSRNSWS